ncbi:hypothetical protein EDB87DRAFT_1647605 [Lactarius vividus]|nr:hypothetical protein EDB87DRAFT_1647605 [Lactarius vividus]
MRTLALAIARYAFANSASPIMHSTTLANSRWVSPGQQQSVQGTEGPLRHPQMSLPESVCEHVYMEWVLLEVLCGAGCGVYTACC